MSKFSKEKQLWRILIPCIHCIFHTLFLFSNPKRIWGVFIRRKNYSYYGSLSIIFSYFPINGFSTCSPFVPAKQNLDRLPPLPTRFYIFLCLWAIVFCRNCHRYLKLQSIMNTPQSMETMLIDIWKIDLTCLQCLALTSIWITRTLFF